MSQKGLYIYSRGSQSWKSSNNKVIEKLGCTEWIEYRKWWGSTERLYPSFYNWYICIKDLGQFPTLRSAEATIFRHSFFKKRNINNGEGSGDEFFEFENYESSRQKACEILVQYDVVFQVIEGDKFTTKPKNLPKQDTEELKDAIALPLITKQEKTKELRPYQIRCIEAMLSVVIGTIVAATGIGKTVIFCEYIKRVRGRYLIVVPSKKLISQTIKTCQKIVGDTFHVCKYSENCSVDKENVIIVGTYQSSHKLVKINNIDCIIFDECHNTVILNRPENTEEYSRYQKLLGHSCKKRFFFTATQKNILSDGKVISMDNKDIYGDVIFRYDIGNAITDGWLCDYMFHLVATKNRINSCVKYIKDGYKTIVFCGKIKTVEQVYQELQTKLPERIKIFKLGNYDDTETNTRLFSSYIGQAVIIVCQKLSVGYDEPQIDTVIHYDLTTSSILTIQRNRATRPYTDKVMAKLVFLCDISGEEEDRREKIRQLNSPIAYLKQIDYRLEKRIEKEKEKSKDEFSTMNIEVEGDFDTQEKKEIYDRCWKVLDRSELSYEQAKKIIKGKINSKKEYFELCKSDLRLPIDPKKEYPSIFVDWIDYFGLERTEYYSLETYKKRFNEKYNLEIDLVKICKELHLDDSKCPYPDIVTDMYKLSNLGELRSLNTVKKVPADFERIFKTNK
jgi:superfamily II DNA or RNA helicase